MKDKKNLNCPVCGYSGNAFELIDNVKFEFNDQKIIYHIYRCSACGSSFANPMRAAPPEYYVYDVPGWRWEFGELLSDLQRDFPEKGALLEVGCNKGNLLQFIKDNINDKQYELYGIDFNQKATSEARSKGLNTFCMTLQDFIRENPNKRFDAVVFFHLLEHLEAPKEFLKLVKSILKPHGQIYFSVPHPERRRLLVDREEWDYPPNHLTRFSIEGIKELLNSSGFNIRYTRDQPPNLGSLGYASFFTYRMYRKIGMNWLYEDSTSRLLKIFFKIFPFIIFFPIGVYKILMNKSRPGLTLYTVVELKKDRSDFENAV